MDFPNAALSFVYLDEIPSTALHPPRHPAPNVKRPELSVLNATMWPRPISYSRFSLGIAAFSKKSGTVELPRMPILFSSAPTEKPGVPRSTMNAENSSPSTFANTVNTSAKPPFVIHIFCPLSSQLFPSGESTARVRSAIASEPACGSDKA